MREGLAELRVLFWSVNFWPNLGGLEMISAELVRSLKQEGVDLCVVAPIHPGQPDRGEFAGIAVHRFPFENPNVFLDVDALFQLKRKIAQLKQDWGPDLVHVSGCNQSLLLHQLTRQTGIPTLVTLHGAIPGSDPGIASVYQSALRSADWICCCSEWTRQELHSQIPECQPRSSTILNALPLREEAPQRRPGGPRFLLCAGRLAPEKGFDTAVQALTHCDPDLILHVAGEGPMQEPLRQLARELGVEGRVQFLGRLTSPELHQEMRNCVAVLAPSLCEGFGLVALEAAWAGAPVIASRVGGLPEVVRHGETGWLVQVNQPVEIAEAIQHLLENPEEARQMGEQARRCARQRFCWSAFVSAYLAQYRILLGGGKRRE